MTKTQIKRMFVKAARTLEERKKQFKEHNFSCTALGYTMYSSKRKDISKLGKYKVWTGPAVTRAEYQTLYEGYAELYGIALGSGWLKTNAEELDLHDLRLTMLLLAGEVFSDEVS